MKITLNVSEDLATRLRELAHREGVTVEALIARMVEKSVEQHGKNPEAYKRLSKGPDI
jgi:predicted transcriptional regulator